MTPYAERGTHQTATGQGGGRDRALPTRPMLRPRTAPLARATVGRSGGGGGGGGGGSGRNGRRGKSAARRRGPTLPMRVASPPPIEAFMREILAEESRAFLPVVERARARRLARETKAATSIQRVWRGCYQRAPAVSEARAVTLAMRKKIREQLRRALSGSGAAWEGAGPQSRRATWHLSAAESRRPRSVDGKAARAPAVGLGGGRDLSPRLHPGIMNSTS
jgi:hypothetical protein